MPRCVSRRTTTKGGAQDYAAGYSHYARAVYTIHGNNSASSIASCIGEDDNERGALHSGLHVSLCSNDPTNILCSSNVFENLRSSYISHLFSIEEFFNYYGNYSGVLRTL